MEIRLKAAGTLWVDGCSLMPSDTVDGIWREVFERIKNISPAVIRFPGGCFADCYHWEDGIGERDTRPVRKMSIGAVTRITVLVWTNIWSSAVKSAVNL